MLAIVWLTWFCLTLAATTFAQTLPPGFGRPAIASDDTVALHVERAWPTDCEPREVDVSISGSDVLVRGTLAPEECADSITPLRIELPATQVARFSFVQRREPLLEDVLVDFVLVPLTERQTRPESGLWWGEDGGLYDTRGPGTAMSLDVQGERLAATINVYHPDGQPVWYFAAGEFTGVTFDAPMHGFTQGQTLFGSYRRPSQAIEVGRLQLEFHGPGQATGWLTAPTGDGAGLALQPVSLVRFDFKEAQSPDRLSGRWLFVPVDALSAEFVLSPPVVRGPVVDYVDLVEGMILSCGLILDRPSSLPDTCSLSDATGAQLGRFSQIGLDRMSGEDAHGNAIYAFRLDWHTAR